MRLFCRRAVRFGDGETDAQDSRSHRGSYRSCRGWSASLRARGARARARGPERTERADRGGSELARPRPRQRHQLLAQGLHPAHQALPRRLSLLHLRGAPPQPRSSVSLHRRRARDCTRGGGSRLPRGVVHPRRSTGTTLPGGAGSAREARSCIHLVLSRTCGADGVRGDRLAAASQPRGHVASRSRPPARGVGLGRHHGRVDVGTPVRAGRPALRLARQTAESAARHPARSRRSGSAVHHRHSHRHRRDAPGTPRVAARDPRHRRAIWSHPGSDRAELPRQAGHPDGGGARALAGGAAVDHRMCDD